MGDVLGIYCSILSDNNEEIHEEIFHYSFGNGRSVKFSDHYDRNNAENLKKGILLLDNTFLLFDVEPNSIREHSRAQGGSIQKHGKSYLFTIELFLEQTEFSNVYCLILPVGYMPTNFIGNKPHFSALINDRIRATWIFKDNLKVKLQFEKNIEEYRNYNYAEDISFFEKYPAARQYYNEAKSWIIQLSAEIISRAKGY